MAETFAQLESFLSTLNWSGLAFAAAAGLVVALAGYRIRLLFFFVIGFYIAAPAAGSLFASLVTFEHAFLVFGTIGGLIGGLVAVRLYYVALFLVGMPVGAAVLIGIVGGVLGNFDLALIVAAIVGGVIGGLVTIALDRVMVIIASAAVGAVHAGLAGATLLFRAIEMSQTAYYATFLGIAAFVAVLGIIYQSAVFPKRSYVFGPRVYADQRAYGDSVSRQFSRPVPRK